MADDAEVRGRPNAPSANDVIGSRVRWQGAMWFVADAQHDLDDTHPDEPGHWHLTLTAPRPIQEPERCQVGHTDRIRGCRYCAARFVAGVADLLGTDVPADVRKVLDA